MVCAQCDVRFELIPLWPFEQSDITFMMKLTWSSCIVLTTLGTNAPMLAQSPQQSPPPAAFSEVRAADLTWVPSAAVPGGYVAILFGDPAKAAPYAIRVRLPAGTRVMPHTHPEDRTYTILAGEWKLGFGRTFDPAALRSYPAGSVYRLPAKVPHFQASDVADTVVQIEGVGPSATDYIAPKNQ